MDYKRSAAGLPRRMLARLLCCVAAGALLVLLGTPAHAAIADKRNDYNSDGISDIAGVNGTSGCLYRWLGNGSGGFAAGVQLGCGWGPYQQSLSGPGDLNGDGVGDLVAVNSASNCLYRWYGNGSGGFGAGTQIGCGWAPYIASLAGAGDLNNDGDGDLVAVNSGNGCLYRWLGNGSGGFGAGTQIGCGWAPYSGYVSGGGDINGDGNADLVAINSGNDCLYRWYGNGGGGFGAGAQIGCGWAPYQLASSFSGMGNIGGGTAGDIVAINSGNGCLYRWLGNGSGGYGAGTQIGCGWAPYWLAA
ncbi:VCBS repeat-containing protein [Streptomyces roseirectus]|uniref:VCBS repeat-containing protein n=1 Tax=Streptomyces roseirectus TaxID=2768066 RepID=A0A7H0I5Y0_9ACTN|nr:VCBS repeat-containing protein [Streptomyces roseirectus]QNP68196.1 VCBS repeat-containing protein [Streptomyces roseirectus]